MSDWSTLFIGPVAAIRWRNSIPDENDLALSFIFRPSDRRVDAVNKRPNWSDADGGMEYGGEIDCWYETTVAVAKARLDRAGLSAPEMDRWIERISGVPRERVPLAIVDPEMFYDAPLVGPLGNPKIRERLDLDSDQYWEDRGRLDDHPTGRLEPLRNLCRILDTTPDDLPVWLDLCYTPATIDEPPTMEEFHIFRLDYDSKVKLTRNYLASAVARFTEREFDIVYIELTIAVEDALHAYLARKLGKKGGRPEPALSKANRMLKDAPLVTILRFVSDFLEPAGPRETDLDLFEAAYGIRNNVVHQGMRQFEAARIPGHISAADRIIEALDALAR